MEYLSDNLSLDLRKRINILKDVGKSYAEIKDQLLVSKSSAHKYVTIYNNTGQFYTNEELRLNNLQELKSHNEPWPKPKSKIYKYGLQDYILNKIERDPGTTIEEMSRELSLLVDDTFDKRSI